MSGHLHEVGSGVRVPVRYAVVIVDDGELSGEQRSDTIDVVLHSDPVWTKYIHTGEMSQSIENIFIESGNFPSRNPEGRLVDMLLHAWNEEFLRVEDGYQVIQLNPDQHGETEVAFRDAVAPARPGLGIHIVRGWLRRNGVRPESVQFLAGVTTA